MGMESLEEVLTFDLQNVTSIQNEMNNVYVQENILTVTYCYYETSGK